MRDEIIWDPAAEMKTLLGAILLTQPEKLLEAGSEGVFAGGNGEEGDEWACSRREQVFE